MPEQSEEQPNAGEALKKALAGIGKAFEKAGHTLKAQAAMGWMFQDDRDQARARLEELPDDKLQTVSVTAAALSSLADEVAAGRGSSGATDA